MFNISALLCMYLMTFNYLLTLGQPHVSKLVEDKKGHAPCKIFLHQRPFLCQFNFLQIISLSQHRGESGHLQLLRILPD